ncbi:MAG TPA: TIGR00730 family Rossman fold protein [Acidimicrobiales bacterium]|nr:TIGR00730 family Rossman fold protein [Acidimicrobiales bacterium]
MSELPADKPEPNIELGDLFQQVADAAGATTNRDQLIASLASIVGMATDDADRLDLKITNAALKEMREAFRVFMPYRSTPKITMFGSARTQSDDPLYALARDLAATLARQGWMVVTGAGPGIMAAGLEGAGRENAMGINIRLPFEQGANEFIAKDPKLVTMKYFFTRKLMLIKESDGFVVLPGGFGTLDEAFELLTLLQTGKAEPSPLVLLEAPGSDYWRGFEEFLRDKVAPRGLINLEDLVLFRITDDVEVAAAEILGFYANYHSLRFVGERLVLRVRVAPDDAELARLNESFGSICISGGIERIATTGAERKSGDHVDLPRLALRFDLTHYARLRLLIDALNKLGSAPPQPASTEESALAGEPRGRAGAMPDEPIEEAT